MRNVRSLATVLLVPFLLECHDQSITAPGVPESARSIAIRLHVNVASGTVETVSDAATQGGSFNVISSGGAPAPAFSLLGSDGIAVQSSNVQQSPLGTKVLVRFDLALTNALKGINLIKPTVPTPPAGVTGIVLFPFQANAAAGSTGKVTPSADWDGTPYNFFNDTHCTGSQTRDCFRWEEYSQLAAGATSAAHTVGFEIDKTVQAFDVVMLLAADLQNVPEAPPAIGLSAASARFETAAGAPPVAILVGNAGGGALGNLSATVTYAAGQLGGWLTATLSSTTAPTLLTLSASPGQFPDGTYNATVAIASPGVTNSPQTVSVTFVVTNSTAVNANAIYVSASDPTAVDDATCGLGYTGSVPGAHPCHSIAMGLSRAGVTGRSEVRVADGRYTEAVTLTNGKSLLGGYQPDTWQRHVSTTNTIIDGASSVGNNDRTVLAQNITSPTLFEGFIVRGSLNNKPSGNSYAIYVANSNQNLVIQNNVIYAGSGGAGLSGTAGSQGVRFNDGVGRDASAAAYDAFITSGPLQCDPQYVRAYSNGGTSAGADNINGGNGGGTRCPTSANLVQMSAQNGISGQSGDGVGGGAAGAGGIGGLDFRLESLGTVCVAAESGTQNGANGGPGANGQLGPAVQGATTGAGVVNGGQWVGAAGQPGIAGFNGGGGGGGGAGGGAFSQSTEEGKDRLGGVGGGGGAGGGGGGGGGAGAPGGGAFGIFIVGAAPIVTDNAIVRGVGGNAGAGGVGGIGAVGAEGGAGGLAAVFCTGAGGHGGKGGSGGAGSGGGGGAGGASFGIYTSGAGTPDYCTSGKNTISGGAAGSGGPGGQSVGNPGSSGAGGVLLTCSFN